MKSEKIVLALLALALAESAQAQAYKCTVNGKSVYQQVPCEGGKQVQVAGTGSAAQVVRLVEVKNATVCTQEAALVFEVNLKTEGFHVLELVFPNLDMNTSLFGSFPAGRSTHQVPVPYMRRVEFAAPIASVQELRFSRYADGAYAPLAEIRNLRLPAAIRPC